MAEDGSRLGQLHGELRALIAPLFAQARSRFTAFAYAAALLGASGNRRPRWQLGEHAGHATPRRLQALLAEYAWDWRMVLARLRRFSLTHLADPEAILLPAGERAGRPRPASAAPVALVSPAHRAVDVRARAAGCHDRPPSAAARPSRECRR